MGRSEARGGQLPDADGEASPRRRASSVRSALHQTVRLLEEVIPGIFMLGVSLAVAYGVFARRVLGSSVSWLNELAIVISAWVVFFGAAAATRHGMHVGIDYLVLRLPPRGQAAANALTSLASAIVVMTIGWLGYRFTLVSGAKLQALDISKEVLLVSLPAGAVLISLELLRQTVTAVRGMVTGRYAMTGIAQAHLESGALDEGVDSSGETHERGR